MKPLVSPPSSSESTTRRRRACCSGEPSDDCAKLSVAFVVFALVLLVFLVVNYALKSNTSSHEVIALKKELSHSVAQQQATQWMAAFASASAISLVVDGKPDASAASHIVGVLWPSQLKQDHLKTNPWQVDGDLTAYNWFSGPMQQHMVLRNGSGYRWVTNGVGAERIVSSSCLSHQEMPDFAQLQKINGSATLWDPESNKSTIALRVLYNGEPFRITAKRHTEPSDDPVILQVEGARMVMQLGLVQDPRERPGYMLARTGGWPKCPQLFDTAPSSTQVLTQEALSVSTEPSEQEIPLPLREWVAQQLRRDDHEAMELVQRTLEATASCGCTQGQKKCLFIHGIDVSEDVGVVDSFPDYWGSELGSKLQCCSDVKFTQFNTMNASWYDRDLARRICTAATAVDNNQTYKLSNSSNATTELKTPSTLKNMVLITHSAGNLNLAAALFYGDCRLDANSSKWIAIEGPMNGTHTANQVIIDCNSSQSSILPVVKHDILRCPPTNLAKSMVVPGMPPSTSCLDKLYALAQRTFREHVNSSMCGVSPFGILSPSSLEMEAASKASHFNTSENDGVVTFDSCRGGLDPALYQTTYRNAFYKADINHDDGRFINGDGLSQNKRPMDWLQCQF